MTLDNATPAPEAPTTDAPTTAAPESTTPTAPVGLTAEHIQSIVEERSANFQNQIEALQRENDALKLAMQEGRQQAPPQQAPEAEDFVTQFNRDPRAAIQALVEQGISQGMTRLAQPFDTLIRSNNQSFLDNERNRIESEFGSKAWDTVFKPQLTESFTAMRRSDPFAIADISRVRREVDTIIGANYSRLTDMRDEHLKTRGATEAERQQKLVEAVRSSMPTGLTGGVRPTARGGAVELSPELKAAIADRDRATGEKTDLNDFAKRMAAANASNIDEWLAATKPAGRAN